MTLHLHLKACYFDAIKSGEKTAEYRLQSKWEKRIVGSPWTEIHLYRGYPKRGDTANVLRRKWKGCTVLKNHQHPHFGPKPVDVLAIDVTGETIL